MLTNCTLTLLSTDDRLERMNDVQERLGRLLDKRWTKSALADEVGMGWMGLHHWVKGERYPANRKLVLVALDGLLHRELIPKQRRRAKGSRSRAREG